MNVCFIIYQWEKINPVTDTSIRLIHEAVKRKHNVGILYSKNFSIEDGRTCGMVNFVKEMDSVPVNVVSFFKKVEFEEVVVPIGGFDAIFIRLNPPFDLTILNLLDSVSSNTFIINDLNGLRKAHNKIYPASFFEKKNDIIPETYISKDKEYLKKVMKESKKNKMILKPLDGFGGKGVIVLDKSAPLNINALIDFYVSISVEGCYVILQELAEGMDCGDVRVLMLNGKAIGAYKRVPAENELRANIKAGGSAVKHVLSEREKYICEMIGPKLVADGLFFVGIDIINGKLIEINVCCPGGITRINKFNKVRLERNVLDFVEKSVKKLIKDDERKVEIKKILEKY